MIRVSFTGRRKINNSYDLSNNVSLCKNLLTKVESIISEHDEVYFYTGGALGTDLLAASLCEFLKEKYKSSKKIITFLALPFRNQSSNWISNDSIKHLESIKQEVNKIIIVSELSDYSSSNTYKQLQLRNEYMVDQTEVVIAVWDGIKSGGTWNCIEYAQKQNKKIIIVTE